MERLTNRLCKDDVLDTQKEPRLKSQAETWLRLCQIEDILGETYDLDRLRELVEADKAGRCVLLPCKVGDRIYKLFCGGAVKLEVERIVCWLSGRWKVNAHTDRKYTDWKGFEIDFSDFGKTVFLTSEAAEAALAKEAYHE